MLYSLDPQKPLVCRQHRLISWAWARGYVSAADCSLKTSFYTLLWGCDQASVFSLVVFMLISSYLTSWSSSMPCLSAQHTTESLPSCCLKTVKHSLTHFPTLLQAGPRPDPKHGISWRSVLLGGKEKGWEALQKSNSVPCGSKKHLK